MNSFTCVDCRGTFPVKMDGGTGYATTDDGEHVCYTCCGKRDAAYLADPQNTRFFGYLKVENIVRGDRNRIVTYSHAGTIQNWPGTLTIPASVRKSRRFTFGGYIEWWVVSATINGRVWSGGGPGPGMYCRLRTKGPKV